MENFKDKKWYVYLLKCSDNSYYCGSTNDLSRRVYEHNNLKVGSKYVRSRRPAKLVWFECLNNKSEAFRLEQKIKKLSHKEKEKLTDKIIVFEYLNNFCLYKVLENF